MKKTITSLLLLIGLCATAQVKIGDNPTTVNASAVLETESTTKGFLPPRMTTAQRDAINNPTVGLMIYNTETKCTETFLGIGVSGTSNTGWKNLCKANINATFTASTLNCAVANSLVGDYVATVAMTEANYKIATVTTLTAGDYTISSDEQNGVKFKAEGTIASVGAGTQLKLFASGVPVDAGTFTYTLTLSGQTCTFNITYGNPPATLLNGSITCSGSLNGDYTSGNVMVSGTNTKVVSVTPTSIGYVSLSTDTVNGVTFSGSSTFVTGDINTLKNITLNASGTPVSSGTYTYTVSGTNISTPCTFTVTYNDQVQYATAQINAASNLNTGSKLSFSSVNTTGITISGSTITLKAGKTYKLTASLRGYGSNWFSYGFANTSNTLLSGSTEGIWFYNYAQSSLPAICIHTVGATDENIELRVTGGGGNGSTLNNEAGGSSLIIEEIVSGRGYLLAKGTNGSGTSVPSNPDVTWSTLKGNGITVSGSSITLAANKRYLVRSYLRVGSAANTDYLEYSIVNSSNTSIGTSPGFWVGPNYPLQTLVPAQAIISTGASAQTIKVRMTLNNGAPTYINSSATSEIEIIELPGDASYNSMAALVGTVADPTIALNSILPLASPNYTSGGMNTSSSTFTLKAGKTYRLTTSLRKTAGDWISFSYVNSNGTALNNNLYGLVIGSQQGSLPAEIIYKTGTADEIVKMKAHAGGSINTNSAHSALIIYELR